MGDVVDPTVDPNAAVEAAPVTAMRERDVDIVLAETLSTDVEFARWFVGQLALGWPTEGLARCDAVISYLRPGAGADATGETDVLARLTYGDGATRWLSIEDKVLASSQVDQGSRHGAFVRGLGQPGASVLVAPDRWMVGRRLESDAYDARVSLDAIAARLRDTDGAVAGWRARVFDQAATATATFEAAPDLDAWTAEVDDVLWRVAGIRLAQQRRQRSATPGRAMSGRFIWCAEDTLAGHHRAVLYLKTASARHRGRAALHVDGLDGVGSSVVGDLAEGRFHVRPSKNGLMIESTSAEGASFSADPVAGQLGAVEAIAAAAKDLQTWWNHEVVARLAG